MNLINFLRDVVIWLSENYSSLPNEFKKKFPERDFVNARLFLFDVCESSSELNQDFRDYE